MSTDRQRNAGIDRMLEATLRAGADETRLPCPDAELLAAFVEQRLAGPERLALESHLSSCAACQEALVVVAGDDVAAGPAFADAGHRQARWVWRWLAPATAVAMMAVLYVAIWSGSVNPATEPASSPQVMTQRSDAGGDETANEAARAADAPPASRSEQAESPGAGFERRPTGEAGPQRPKPEAPLDVRVAAETVRPTAAKPATGPAPAATAAVSEVPPSVPVMARRDETPSPEKRPAAAGDPAALGAQAVIPGREAQPRVVAVSKAEPAPVQQKAAAEPSAARMQAETIEAGGPAKERAVVATVVAPGGETLWRLGPENVVWKSADGGRTWAQQVFDAPVELTAGHAPSTSVCWVVGKAGAVLLTTNGHEWVPVPKPLDADLVAVQARDALTATVTAVDGRRFRTADGGKTWTAIRQE